MHYCLLQPPVWQQLLKKQQVIVSAKSQIGIKLLPCAGSLGARRMVAIVPLSPPPGLHSLRGRGRPGGGSPR